MTLDDFRQSLTAAEPPAGIMHALAGLWQNPVNAKDPAGLEIEEDVFLTLRDIRIILKESRAYEDCNGHARRECEVHPK
jgi:hypothetical protein